MHINEKKIIKDCKKGDLEKFSGLYDIYVDKIYRFIFYKTSHKETAEDLTSETFIKALKAIDRFDDNKGAFQAWLFRIARNTVIDFYRVKKNLVNIEDVWELGHTDNVENVLSTQDDLRKVREYLGKLTPLQREVVILRVWDNMPYKQIAEIVNITEGNCKMIFSRTIKKIRQDIPLLVMLFLVGL